MQAVAIGAFHHQQVAVFAFGGTGVHHFARRNFAVMHPANVAGKQQLFRLAAGIDRNLRHGRSENVRGPHEAKRKLPAQLFDFAKVDRPKQGQALLRLFHRVQRQGWVMFRRLGFVVELGVFFLQVSGIGEQNAAEVDGRGGGIDRTVKALLDQARNPAGVIEMRVGENHRIDRTCRHRQILPVALPPFFLSLEEAAIDEHLQATCAVVIHMDQMLRSGHHTRSTEKLNVTQAVSPRWPRLAITRQHTVVPFSGHGWQMRPVYGFSGAGTS